MSEKEEELETFPPLSPMELRKLMAEGAKHARELDESIRRSFQPSSNDLGFFLD